MITISQNQALKRWDALPDTLREALYSEVGSGFLWRTCEAEHIPKEKIYAVSKIAGYVLLGFLHPGDFGLEIKEVLALNPQIAETIAKAINERIFKPLEADLNRIYAPPGSFDNGLPPISFADIKRPSVAPAPAAQAPIPVKTPPPFAPFGGGESPAPTISVAPKIPPAPAMPPRPAPPPAPGRIEPSTAFLSRSVPITPPTASVSASSPSDPSGGGKTKPMPVPIGNEPAPMMLHEEAVMKPVRPPSSFNLNISSLPKTLDAKPKETIPVKPALLELGAMSPSTGGSQKTTAPEAKMPRVVHYTELRTPLTEPISDKSTPVRIPSTMVSQTEGREVHEITGTTSPPPLNKPQPVPPPTPAPVSPRIEPPKMNDVRPFDKSRTSPLTPSQTSGLPPRPPAPPPPTTRPAPLVRKDFVAPPPTSPPPPPFGGPLRPPTPPQI